MKKTVHNCCAARICQQFALITNQSAGWRMEDKAQAIAARGPHFDHFCFSLRHFLNDDARMLFINVNHDFFNRLKNFSSIVFFENDFWTRHAELKSLATHGLNQNCEL